MYKNLMSRRKNGKSLDFRGEIRIRFHIHIGKGEWKGKRLSSGKNKCVSRYSTVYSSFGHKTSRQCAIVRRRRTLKKV